LAESTSTTQAPPAPYRLRVTRPSLPPLESFAEALEPVWERGMLSNNGPCVEAFQEAFANYCGAHGRVLATSSCDVALTLAIAALDLPPGSKALVPSFGFPSSVHALQWNGLRPHFLDVDPHDWCLHEEQVAAALDADVTLIVATHMFGVACDVHGLQRAAASVGAALVLDAAQAAATWVADRHVVDFGDASAISFSGAKIVTAGEGGLAVLRSAAVAARFAQLRTYGLDERRESVRLGLNGKLSELHAALGTLTIERIEQDVADRTAHVATYTRRLAGLDGLGLQAPPPAVRRTPAFFVVDLGRARDGVRATLAEYGIEARPYFPALHRMRRFAATPRSDLTVTERLHRSLLALPLYSELELSEVEEVCDIVVEALAAFHRVEG
jgi:dTDP-4-amino-4,6-dideoxygalactose transaminase